MKSIKSQITLSLYRSFFQRKVEHRQHTSNWSYNWRSISPRCKAHVWYQFLTKYWVSYAIHLFHYVICKEGALSKCGLPLLVRIRIEIANHSYLNPLVLFQLYLRLFYCIVILFSLYAQRNFSSILKKVRFWYQFIIKTKAKSSPYFSK